MGGTPRGGLGSMGGTSRGRVARLRHQLVAPLLPSNHHARATPVNNRAPPQPPLSLSSPTCPHLCANDRAPSSSHPHPHRQPSSVPVRCPPTLRRQTSLILNGCAAAVVHQSHPAPSSQRRLPCGPKASQQQHLPAPEAVIPSSSPSLGRHHLPQRVDTRSVPRRPLRIWDDLTFPSTSTPARSLDGPNTPSPTNRYAAPCQINLPASLPAR